MCTILRQLLAHALPPLPFLLPLSVRRLLLCVLRLLPPEPSLLLPMPRPLLPLFPALLLKLLGISAALCNGALILLRGIPKVV